MLLDKLRVDEYHIGLIRQPIHSLLTCQTTPQIEWLPQPPSIRFLADPFGIQRDDNLFIFFELLQYGKRDGEIAFSRINSHRQMSEPETVLRLPFHLSYPYLFEFDGEIYCIPETYQAHEIALYKICDFPRGWRKVKTLIDNVAMVDASIQHFHGYWWLFCSSKDCQELWIWYADHPFGPWHRHEGAPVKVDLRSARPAGTLFVHKGTLYRPAQDCYPRYGSRTIIHRITVLSPTQIQEEPVVSVEPDRTGCYPYGLHTVSAVGDFTLIDGCRRTYTANPYELLLKARAWLHNAREDRSLPDAA
jgi:hypothetical protein